MLMERDDAVRLAVERAEAEGWDLSAFEEPEADRADDGWVVRFAGRDPAPGNHLVVTIDIESGEVTVWPGR